MNSDFDGGWKDALDHFLAELLALLAPDVHAEIDWAQNIHSLEQEFRNPVPHPELNSVTCDKLLHVTLREDDEEALLHAEAQCQVRANFPRRAWIYNQLAGLRYHWTVSTLAILGDDDPGWRPTSYYQGRWGSRTGLDFCVVKLLDFVGREDELENHENVAGLIVLAHLLALATRQDLPARRAARLRMWRAIRRRRELEHDQHYRLLGIIERFLALPPAVEVELRREFRQETEEIPMPYMIAFERIAREEAREEALIEGRERGIRLGLRTVAEVRFGDPDAAFLALLEAADLPRLEEAMRQARTVGTLDELRALLAPTNGVA